MAKQGIVALKTVVPVIPKGSEEKAMLEEDLGGWDAMDSCCGRGA